MTEQHKSNETNEITSNASKTATQSTVENGKSQRQKRSGLFASIIILVIIVILGGGFYYYLNLKYQQIVNESSELQQQISKLLRQQETEKQQINQIIESQRISQLDNKEYEQKVEQRVEELQAQITTLSSTDVKHWLLAQADFLAKMAGRKLWNDYDPFTAIALLKSADSSLAEMNAPHLIEIRKAINHDISVLSAISQIDYDGIILKLNQLSRDIDNLRINDNAPDGKPMDEDSTELSNNIADWKQNLSQSWKNFSKNFITIRRRDSHETPLLAPNQDIYLRANIRAQLLIATQAVPRYQEQIYKQSLEQVSTWIRIYFNTNDAATKAFLSELDTLIEQPITMDIPSELKSLLLLEKALQKRIQGQITTPATPVAPKTQPTNKKRSTDDIKIVPPAPIEEAVKTSNRTGQEKAA
ncbi:MAG: uroporphyrinogen-III C-methyltransferase [Arsenophonus endosymbiont of Dermacentor nuttalli]